MLGAGDQHGRTGAQGDGGGGAGCWMQRVPGEEMLGAQERGLGDIGASGKLWVQGSWGPGVSGRRGGLWGMCRAVGRSSTREHLSPSGRTVT